MGANALLVACLAKYRQQAFDLIVNVARLSYDQCAGGGIIVRRAHPADLVPRYRRNRRLNDINECIAVFIGIGFGGRLHQIARPEYTRVTTCCLAASSVVITSISLSTIQSRWTTVQHCIQGSFATYILKLDRYRKCCLATPASFSRFYIDHTLMPKRRRNSKATCLSGTS